VGDIRGPLFFFFLFFFCSPFFASAQQISRSFK
jgi:hypothetical protein